VGAYRSGKLRREELRRYDLGLAKLRRDGFVSLDADQQNGTVLTRPLAFAGKNLFVNADVRDGGYIKVALLTRGQQPIAGYSTEDSMAITEGSVKVPVRWQSATELDVRPGYHTRIRFELKNAGLYSFWIE